jgi:peptidyl-prolyl cis-trans isomerase D
VDFYKKYGDYINKMLTKITKSNFLSNIVKIGAKKLILSILIVLLALTLIPWSGSGNFFNNVSSDKWITVGNKDVHANIILGEYQQFVQRNYMYLQSNPMALGKYLNTLIGQYVSILLLSNEANNINLVVNEELLLNLVAKMPVFQDEKGVFDKNKFEMQINQTFGNEQIFLDTISNNILKEQLIESMYPLVKEPQYISYLDYVAITQQRVIKYVEITPDMVKSKIGKPTNKELEEIRDSNLTNFETKEQRDILYYTIDTKNLYDNIKIPLEEIKAYYTKNIANYIEPEKKDLTQFIFSSKEEADKAYSKLINTDIKKAPKDLTLINVGLVEFEDLPEELSKEVFKSPLKVFSKPIQTQAGWHIVYVNQTIASAPKSLDKVKAEINKELLEAKKNELLNNVKNDVLNHINQNDKNKTTGKGNLWDYIEYKNLTIDSPLLSKIALENAFKLALNNSTNLLEDANGNLYAIKVLNINPKKLKDFEDIKPQLTRIWITKKENEEIIKLASEINLEIANSNIANFKKYAVKTITTKQTDDEKKHPFNLKSQQLLFESEKNLTNQISLKNGNIAVAVVVNVINEKIEFSDKETAKNKDLKDYNEFSSKSYAQSFLESYAKLLESKYDVYVNEKAILNTLAPQEQQ